MRDTQESEVVMVVQSTRENAVEVNSQLRDAFCLVEIRLGRRLSNDKLSFLLRVVDPRLYLG